MRTFVGGVEEMLRVNQGGRGGIDAVLLNAGVVRGNLVNGRKNGGWCEEVVVNHFGESVLRSVLDSGLGSR